MSNEVKERIRNTTIMGEMIEGKPYFTWDQILAFLDQFEGYKLVKDEPTMFCAMCNKTRQSETHLYHRSDGWIWKLCKSCFDKQCTEPAAKPAFKSLDDVTVGDCDRALTGLEAHPIAREIIRLVRYDALNEQIRNAPAEPEPWKELKAGIKEAYKDCPPELPCDLEDIFEAAYPEIQRRTSRMIAEAIKAERERIGRALRNVKDKTTAVDDSFTVVLRLWAEFEQEASR